jgi:hypothetical protein
MRVLLFCFLLLPFGITAQKTYPNGTVFIEIKGRIAPYIGMIQDESRDTVVLKSENGLVVNVPRDKIVHIDFVSFYNQVDLARFEKKRHTGVYFAQTSNFGMQAGTWQYRNMYGLLNQIEYGFSKRFSIGVGVAPMFLFSESELLTPFWIMPKITLPISDNLHFGVTGVLAKGFEVPSFISYKSDIFAALLPSVTIGRHNHHLTLGAGILRNGGSRKTPLFSVAGTTPVRKNWLFITENIIYRDYDGYYLILNEGFRCMFDRWAFHIGVFGIVNFDYNEVYPILPAAGFSIPFR